MHYTGRVKTRGNSRQISFTELFLQPQGLQNTFVLKAAGRCKSSTNSESTMNLTNLAFGNWAETHRIAIYSFLPMAQHQDKMEAKEREPCRVPHSGCDSCTRLPDEGRGFPCAPCLHIRRQLCLACGVTQKTEAKGSKSKSPHPVSQASLQDIPWPIHGQQQDRRNCQVGIWVLGWEGSSESSRKSF